MLSLSFGGEKAPKPGFQVHMAFLGSTQKISCPENYTRARASTQEPAGNWLVQLEAVTGFYQPLSYKIYFTEYQLADEKPCLCEKNVIQPSSNTFKSLKSVIQTVAESLWALLSQALQSLSI